MDYSAAQKGGNAGTCHHMVHPGHGAGGKPAQKDRYGFTSMRNLTKSSSHRKEVERWMRGWEAEGLVLNGQFQFCKMKICGNE